MSTKKILIIQTSPQHTASTFLVNALYGVIEKLKDIPITFESHDYFDDISIFKCHDTNIDNLIKKYKNIYDELYFVCSQRIEYNLYIDAKYASYSNVIIFDYVELNETNENTIPNIIDNIYNKLQNLLSKHAFITLNKQTAIERILNMNKKCNEIKNKSFNYIDLFFHIHGSHRNRTNGTPDEHLNGVKATLPIKQPANAILSRKKHFLGNLGRTLW